MDNFFDPVVDFLFTDIRQLHKFKFKRPVETINDEPKFLLPSIVAVATHAGPKKNNEDAVMMGSSWNHIFLTIADGVGGCTKSKEAAETAVNVVTTSIKVHIQKCGTIQYQDIKPIYEQAAKSIRDNKLGKTTLISIIEKPKCFIFSYLGDGQAYLLRGDTEAGVPLMIGHRKNGLLGGVISSSLTAEPVIMQISKGFISGEIIIAGTDGIFNDDIHSKRPDLLSELITTIRNTPMTKKFTQVLYDFLDKLNYENLLEDNASLGIIITNKAAEALVKGRCQ